MQTSLGYKTQSEMSDGMQGFLHENVKSSGLRRGEFRRLMRKMREARERGDERKWKQVRTKIAENNYLLVQKVVKKWSGKGGLQHLKESDLFNEGVLGLLTAIDKFDLDRDVEFSTYAMWWIQQRVRRAIHDQDRTIRIPVHRIESGVRVKKITDELTEKLDRIPTEDEIAEVYHERYPKASSLRRKPDGGTLPPHTLSYDRATKGSRNFGAGEDNTPPIIETIPDPGDGPDAETSDSDYLDEIEAHIALLDKKDSDILRRRFALKPYEEVHTYAEIGKAHKLSAQGAQQRVESAIKLLKEFPVTDRLSGEQDTSLLDREEARGLMEEQGVSYAALQRRCGVSRNTLHMIFNNGVNPRIETIHKIAFGLNVKPERILR
jgi:RNA polymerase sigma factor (sigma-70 family)